MHSNLIVGRGSVTLARKFDFDIVLLIAAPDDSTSLSRRMFASAAIGVPLDDGYYSVRELREVATGILNPPARRSSR